ncbi:hypothetical protein AMATHDRAFT_68087 [Amanita thiersii Skay4041]|uniref:Uncharacterized protein n=1 Tax=Amanita thiersii Skay4041 TaxID=703135 RepID=A0A2A9NHS2_9AGAR|nr:hypothetical protein AMATHDRAFT_68087 [Amanita thiersii Skay4041]
MGGLVGGPLPFLLIACSLLLFYFDKRQKTIRVKPIADPELRRNFNLTDVGTPRNSTAREEVRGAVSMGPLVCNFSSWLILRPSPTGLSSYWKLV